jgi:hypothetical protein
MMFRRKKVERKIEGKTGNQRVGDRANKPFNTYPFLPVGEKDRFYKGGLR